jgi:hypothetical protein
VAAGPIYFSAESTLTRILTLLDDVADQLLQTLRYRRPDLPVDEQAVLSGAGDSSKFGT